jgi:hypothetical protein
MYHPNHFHFGAIMKAIYKQIKFQIRWHKQSYKEYKVANKIKLPAKQKTNSSPSRDFNLVIRSENVLIRGEDKDLVKCLVYQNEIVSSLQSKGLNF